MSALDPFWSLSIDVPRRDLDALSARLLQQGFPSFEERPVPKGVRVIVYSSDPEALDALRVALQREGAGAGASGTAPNFCLALVPPDWALEWTRHLEPVALTPSLTLYPRRPTQAPAAGELYLEPAFAFGFGEHVSTRLAACWLEQACRAAPGGSVLDVGCGTGVLSLVAHHSGARSVLGIDVSEPAIDAARSNAELNGRVAGVCFERVAVEDVSAVFQLVVANIEAGVLCALAGGIAPRLAPGGVLALAGFISEQCEAIVRAYAEQGIRLERRECIEDWCLLVGSVGP